jgi:hypothetical protein
MPWKCATHVRTKERNREERRKFRKLKYRLQDNIKMDLRKNSSRNLECTQITSAFVLAVLNFVPYYYKVSERVSH